jgi:ABC-2 type transport system permease protein
VARVRKKAAPAPAEAAGKPKPTPAAVVLPAEPEPEPELEAEAAPALETGREPEWVGKGIYEPLYGLGVTRVLAIAGREVGSLLVSPIGWVITPIVIVVVSWFGYLTPVIVGQQASMDSVFGLIAFLLILPIVPLTTMRVLAEERRQGTLEMLLTSPVRDWELVVGKWLGSLGFFGLMFSFTLVYVGLFLVYLPKVTVHPLGIPLTFGDVDFGLLLSGYLGLLALGASFIAIGVLCSSITQNQIVAAFLTFGALLVLYYCGTASQFLLPPYSAFFDYLGAMNRYQGFSQGQIALKDAVYFLSLTFAALFLATRVLESRRWR